MKLYNEKNRNKNYGKKKKEKKIEEKKEKIKLITPFNKLLLASFFLFFILFFVGKSYAWSSDYSDWQYRKEITITEQSGNTLTNYQVKLTIDTASLISEGKMNSDCSDIRFTDENDNPLPYWIESGCNSANTVVWVKVPNIPANGETTIYMYYGNPSATSESNGDNVFEFFDDFDGTSLNTDVWEIYSGSSVTVENGYVEIGSADVSYDYNQIRTKTTYTSGKVFIARIYVDNNAFYDVLRPEIDWINYGTHTYVGVTLSDSNENARTENALSGTASIQTIGSLPEGSWYNIELKWWPDGSSTGIVEGIGQSSVTDVKVTNSLHIALGHHESGSAMKVDYVGVAKLTSPEPTYSIGTEETNGGETNQAPKITIYSPQNITYYTNDIQLNFTVTDDANTTFPVKAYFGDNLIYDNSNYENGSIVVLNLSDYITQGGSYYVKVVATDTDPNPATSEKTVYFTVGEYELLNVSYDTDTYEFADQNVTVTYRVNWDIVSNITLSLTSNSDSDYLTYSSQKIYQTINETHLIEKIEINPGTVTTDGESKSFELKETVSYVNGTTADNTIGSYQQNVYLALGYCNYGNNALNYYLVDYKTGDPVYQSTMNITAKYNLYGHDVTHKYDFDLYSTNQAELCLRVVDSLDNVDLTATVENPYYLEITSHNILNLTTSDVTNLYIKMIKGIVKDFRVYLDGKPISLQFFDNGTVYNKDVHDVITQGDVLHIKLNVTGDIPKKVIVLVNDTYVNFDYVCLKYGSLDYDFQTERKPTILKTQNITLSLKNIYNESDGNFTYEYEGTFKVYDAVGVFKFTPIVILGNDVYYFKTNQQYLYHDQLTPLSISKTDKTDGGVYISVVLNSTIPMQHVPIKRVIYAKNYLAGYPVPGIRVDTPLNEILKDICGYVPGYNLTVGWNNITCIPRPISNTTNPSRLLIDGMLKIKYVDKVIKKHQMPEIIIPVYMDSNGNITTTCQFWEYTSELESPFDDPATAYCVFHSSLFRLLDIDESISTFFVGEEHKPPITTRYCWVYMKYDFDLNKDEWDNADLLLFKAKNLRIVKQKIYNKLSEPVTPVPSDFYYDPLVAISVNKQNSQIIYKPLKFNTGTPLDYILNDVTIVLMVLTGLSIFIARKSKPLAISLITAGISYYVWLGILPIWFVVPFALAVAILIAKIITYIIRGE